MSVLYYMPMFLVQEAQESGNEDLQQFCELFKVVSPNACILDRTGVIYSPFETSVLYPLPERSEFASLTEEGALTFEKVCMNRAREIMNTRHDVVLMYSGGLDSSVVLLSILRALKNDRRSTAHVSVAATPFSIIENPTMWREIVLPNFDVISTDRALELMGYPNGVRFVFGENADQLFGSDIILKDFSVFDQKVDTDQMVKFISGRGVLPKHFDWVLYSLMNLAICSPVQLKTMADFIWWLNFSTKWQSVSLRGLCFSNFLNVVKDVSDLKRFEPFFNTPQFQWLSMYGNLQKWGSDPSILNYKKAARDFLRTEPCLQEYADTKVKVPSLYRVLTSTSTKYKALGLEGSKIVELNSVLES